MPEPTTCSLCHQPIVACRGLSGIPVALDAAVCSRLPDAYLLIDGIALHWREPLARFFGESNHHRPHAATCPKREEQP